LVSLDDKTLAAELALGRHEALTVLFKRHSGAVFRTARRILGDSGEAEEVVQQVFLELYRQIGEFSPEKGSFASWLIRRAVYRAVNRKDHLKTEGFYFWTELDEERGAAEPGDGTAPLYQQEIGTLLEQLLRRLPRRQRRVINLTYFEGLTAEEIAKQTDDSVHVVRHLLYEGLKKLRSAAQRRSPAKSGKNG
jgi:RNA polymerase sigma-70 factor (ECF subfamily)